ncbi:MAG: hypothetical protein KGI54_05890 [Pseudomonadota bacterium]|nr:hypothetical protein [Pseudomonadota bacterium]
MSTNKDQLFLYYQAGDSIAKRDRAFMEMINDPKNPMTNADLKALILHRPAIYSRYKGFIGKLI